MTEFYILLSHIFIATGIFLVLWYVHKIFSDSITIKKAMIMEESKGKLSVVEKIDPLKKGIYFLTTRTANVEQGMLTIQDALNNPQFARGELVQIIVTNEAGQNKITGQVELLYFIVAVVRIESAES